MKQTLKKHKRGGTKKNKNIGGTTKNITKQDTEPQGPQGALSWLDAVKLSFANMSAVILSFFLNSFTDDDDE
jgi:hypothetical protein